MKVGKASSAFRGKRAPSRNERNLICQTVTIWIETAIATAVDVRSGIADANNATMEANGGVTAATKNTSANVEGSSRAVIRAVKIDPTTNTRRTLATAGTGDAREIGELTEIAPSMDVTTVGGMSGDSRAAAKKIAATGAATAGIGNRGATPARAIVARTWASATGGKENEGTTADTAGATSGNALETGPRESPAVALVRSRAQENTAATGAV
jgi:hypothetical protein